HPRQRRHAGPDRHADPRGGRPEPGGAEGGARQDGAARPDRQRRRGGALDRPPRRPARRLGDRRDRGGGRRAHPRAAGVDLTARLALVVAAALVAAAAAGVASPPRELAFVRTTDGTPQIWTVAIGGTPHRMTSSGANFDPAWSP